MMGQQWVCRRQTREKCSSAYVWLLSHNIRIYMWKKKPFEKINIWRPNCFWYYFNHLLIDQSINIPFDQHFTYINLNNKLFNLSICGIFFLHKTDQNKSYSPFNQWLCGLFCWNAKNWPSLDIYRLSCQMHISQNSDGFFSKSRGHGNAEPSCTCVTVTWYGT